VVLRERVSVLALVAIVGSSVVVTWESATWSIRTAEGAIRLPRTLLAMSPQSGSSGRAVGDPWHEQLGRGGGARFGYRAIGQSSRSSGVSLARQCVARVRR
jgi:hypothetical protein